MGSVLRGTGCCGYKGRIKCRGDGFSDISMQDDWLVFLIELSWVLQTTKSVIDLLVSLGLMLKSQADFLVWWDKRRVYLALFDSHCDRRQSTKHARVIDVVFSPSWLYFWPMSAARIRKKKLIPPQITNRRRLGDCQGHNRGQDQTRQGRVFQLKFSEGNPHSGSYLHLNLESHNLEIHKTQQPYESLSIQPSSKQIDWSKNDLCERSDVGHSRRQSRPVRSVLSSVGFMKSTSFWKGFCF